jgi:hypothetical protein
LDNNLRNPLYTKYLSEPFKWDKKENCQFCLKNDIIEFKPSIKEAREALFNSIKYYGNYIDDPNSNSGKLFRYWVGDEILKNYQISLKNGSILIPYENLKDLDKEIKEEWNNFVLGNLIKEGIIEKYK